MEQPKIDIPELQDPALLAFLNEHGHIREFRQGEVIMDIGGYIKFIPILLKGAIKVLREDDQGDELLLYYLYPGQTCSMTLNCCQAQASSKVRAIAEENCVLLSVPVGKMEELTSNFKSWLQFVLNTHSQRFEELLATVDSIAFKQMDQRLLEYLNQKVAIAKTSKLTITHQDIAYDLHSSREVISRLLKQLEKLGKVRLTRGAVELTTPV